MFAPLKTAREFGLGSRSAHFLVPTFSLNAPGFSAELVVKYISSSGDREDSLHNCMIVNTYRHDHHNTSILL